MGSLLKTPQASIGMALATSGLVYGLYTLNIPSLAGVHATKANDINIQAGRKKAAITAGVAVVGVSAISRDINVFIVAGALLIVLDASCRHANASSPKTGQLVSPDGGPAVTGVSAVPVAA